jgi:hypothetical protein
MDTIPTVMTIIKADGTREDRTVDLAEQPSYNALQRIMGPIFAEQRGKPANFEHVNVLHDGKRTDMFVDEYGALRDMLLPVNLVATRIYHAASIKQDRLKVPGGIISSAPKIHGTAVLFGRRVWF